MDKKSPYKIPARQYWTIHAWVRRNKPKSGICIECKKTCKTWWANISGEYKRSLDDYKEMCPSCHRKMDYTDEWRHNVSLATKGKNNPFYGKKHSKETKEKLRFYGKNREFETDDRGFYKKFIKNNYDTPPSNNTRRPR